MAITKGKLWTLSSRQPQTTIKLNSYFDHPHEKTQPAGQRVPREKKKKEEFSCGYNERETLDLVQPPTPNDDQTELLF